MGQMNAFNIMMIDQPINCRKEYPCRNCSTVYGVVPMNRPKLGGYVIRAISLRHDLRPCDNPIAAFHRGKKSTFNVENFTFDVKSGGFSL